MVPAINEIVPVGAIEVSWALRRGAEPANRLSAKAGNGPRSSASRADAACATCLMVRAIRPARPNPPLAVIRDAQAGQHLRQAHNTQPDLAGGPGGHFEFGDGIAADVDDVVKKAHGQLGNLGEPIPVDAATADHPGEVDGAQVARLVGQQRNFPTRVGGLDPAPRRRRVGAVDGVEEHQSRVAASMRGLADRGEQIGSRHLCDRLAGSRVDQPVGAIARDGAQELRPVTPTERLNWFSSLGESALAVTKS